MDTNDRIGGSSVKRHLTVIYIVLILLVLVGIFTSIFETKEGKMIPEILWFAIEVIIVGGVIAVLLKMSNIADELESVNRTFHRVIEANEKSRATLEEIASNTKLSETAKSIASRDVDRKSIRDAVLIKIHQSDFDGAMQIIDEIAKSTPYHELADEMKSEADKYRNSGENEQIDQAIEYIEQLLENHQWTKAATVIEKLNQDHPNNDRAAAMKQKLVDKQAERKKQLLKKWDDAVQRNDVDRSLSILKELDLYLTPSEGLALQEAARDVFRNKLHSLGVRFSMAVSEKRWKEAVQTGEEIIRDFPNSRMAHEIHDRMDILRKRVK